MWAAQFIGYENPNTWLNSGGLGTMGYSVPAAMGAKVGMPDSTVWAIDGDGCFQMTNQELATCTINDIPIKVAIINNESLGMVRQWQTLFYNERYSNTDLHSKRIPDFVKLADAYGCVGLACEQPRRRRRHHRARRWRSTTCRSSSTSGCTATRWSGRWSPPAPATTTSSTPATSRPSSRRATWSSVRDDRNTKHTLSVLVENKPGVLARIAGLFSRRGFNIDSLAVGPTEHPEVSRMTIVVDVEDTPLEQVTKQLNKLIEVIKIVELDGPASVNRELLLVKVKADAESRGQVLDAVQLFRAKVVDVAPDAVTIQATGNADKLGDLLRVLEPFGIRELVQSGMVAIGRGSRSISERSLRPGPAPPRPPDPPRADTYKHTNPKEKPQWLRCSTTTTPTCP